MFWGGGGEGREGATTTVKSRDSWVTKLRTVGPAGPTTPLSPGSPPSPGAPG